VREVFDNQAAVIAAEYSIKLAEWKKANGQHDINDTNMTITAYNVMDELKPKQHPYLTPTMLTLPQ
jgi:hypothetical protein